jgi:uncharacterized protein involved in tolerance to divalent cations
VKQWWKRILKQINREMLLICENIEELLEMMKNYQAPNVGKMDFEGGSLVYLHYRL